MANWPWLELAKLGADILIPLTLAAVGYYLNKHLKSIEHNQWTTQRLIQRRLDQSQWEDQTLIAKRIALYDKIAPDLNKLLCFYAWRGYWKDVSPAHVITTKRSLDKNVNIYRYLLGEAFYEHYNAFIGMLFETYSGPGHDAYIKSHTKSKDGDRKQDANYAWDTSWNEIIGDKHGVVPKATVVEAYEQLMKVFRSALGIRALQPTAVLSETELPANNAVGHSDPRIQHETVSSVSQT